MCDSHTNTHVQSIVTLKMPQHKT